MGACTSCCKAPELARSSRYAGDHVPTRVPVNHPIHSEQREPLSAAQNSQTEPKASDQSVLTVRPIVITDKKMFNPYSKLPPIKKPSNGENKRMSLVAREFSEAKANALFDQYKDSDDDCIFAEGIEKFCEDLEVRPDEFIVLVLAWRLNAQTMCLFTREQFVNGCQTMRVDSIKAMQAKFEELLAEVSDKDVFKEFYRWTYKFGLDQESGQRTLPIEMAMSLWKLVFSQDEPRLLPRWLNYLQKHQLIRGISKDTWDMFFNFVEQVGEDLSTYDDTEAWPSLLDDFVEYENDCQNQNVETQDDMNLAYNKD